MAFSGDNLGAANIPYRAAAGSAPASNPGTDARLWLPIWSGEVINAYDEYNSFESLVTSRQIASGYQMEFPITGTVGLTPSWDAGVELGGGDNNEGSAIISDSFTVTLDKRPMAAHFELDNIDQMVSQWEYRAELARQAGIRLANTRDKQIGTMIARAAVNSIENPKLGTTTTCELCDSGSAGASTILWEAATGVRGMQLRHQYGFVRTRSEFEDLGNNSKTAAERTTAALELLLYIEDFMVRQQEASIPEEAYYLAVDPRTFQDIRALGVARSSSDLGGSFTVPAFVTGSSAEDDGSQAAYTAAGGGMRPMFGGVEQMGGLGAGLSQGMFNIQDSLIYMGVTILKSNHLPNVDYKDGALSTTGEQIGGERYCVQGSTAGIKAVMFAPSAIASIRLQGLKVDTVDDVRRNTVFTVASMMHGTGILAPEKVGLVIDGAKYASVSGHETATITSLNATDTDDSSAEDLGNTFGGGAFATLGAAIIDCVGNGLFEKDPDLNAAFDGDTIPLGLGTDPGLFSAGTAGS